MNRSVSEPEREKFAGEITALQTLSVAQLKARWQTLYKTEAPSRFSRDLLLWAVALPPTGAGAWAGLNRPPTGYFNA
jgi:hypothetical protein